MDRVTPVVLGTLGYAMISAVLSLTLTPPKHLDSRERKNYCGFYVSLLHSLTACGLVICVLWAEGGVRYNSDFNNTHAWVLGLSVGYFIYDIVYGEWFGLHDNMMRFHHVFALIGCGISYCSVTGGVLTLYAVLIAECSTPAMQMRFILSAHKQENITLYRIAQAVFALQFVFNRVVIGVPISYNTWFYDISWGVKVSSAMVAGVSMIWSLIIFGMIAKELPQGTVLQKALESLRNIHRSFPLAVNGFVLGNALFTPSLLKAAGAGPLHCSILGYLVF